MADQGNRSGRQMVDVEALQAMYPAHIKGAKVEEDIEMTRADTECAQALLELARSFATHHPVNIVNNNIDTRSTGDMRSVLNPLSSNKSPPKRKQMHVTVKKLSVGRGSPLKKARKPNKINEFPAQEIVDRIKLDHTYALPVNAMEYQRQVDPAFYSLLDEVEGGEEGPVGKSLIKHNSAAKVAKTKYGAGKGQVQTDYGNPRPPSDTLNWQNKMAQSGFLKSEPGVSLVSPAGVARDMEADRNGNNKNNKSMDLYQPDDSKYKNFNLLLKCLTNEGPHDKKSGISSTLLATESSSLKKEDNQTHERLERESPQEVKCDLCTKTFSSKIYLRKHKQHMHSNVEYEAKTEVPESEVCLECSLNVEKKKMNEHKSICCMKQGSNNLQSIVNKSLLGSASNIATCQFCAVKLRRPLLLKHLADKHCLENKEDCMLSDSGSSTVSGSDVENKCLSSFEEENIIQCDICFAFVPKPLLSQHVAEKHFNMVSGTGYIAGLNDNELTASEGGSLTTGQEVSSQRTSYSSNQDHQESQDCSVSSPKSAGAFKQYMLQRFLDDNSNGFQKDDVNSFSNNVKKDNDLSPKNSSLRDQSALVAGVKVSRQNIATTNTRGIYTVVVTKEKSVSRSSTEILRPSPVEQLKL